MVINNRAVKVHLLFKLKYAILLFSDMILQRFDCSPQGIYELRFSLLLPCSVGTLVACVVLVHLAHADSRAAFRLKNYREASLTSRSDQLKDSPATSPICQLPWQLPANDLPRSQMNICLQA